MTNLRSWLEMRIDYWEQIYSKASGLNKDIALLALSDLRTVLNGLIQEEKWEVK